MAQDEDGGSSGEAETRPSAGAGTVCVRRALPEAVVEVLDPARAKKLPSAGARFEVREEIARGGMGSVLRAYDQVMRREVAIKRVARGDHAGRVIAEEAQIAGQLQHPNIVPVHDIDVDPESGALLFTMQLVRGETFARVVRHAHREPSTPVALARLVRIVLRLCEALSYAHGRGVIHCDIKPENVMVGDHGEVYLVDWGLAVTLPGRDEQREEAPTGGTPAYMAPEQHDQDPMKLSVGTDVFGLGGLLYEVMTGHGPNWRPEGAPPLGTPRWTRPLVVPADSWQEAWALPPRLVEIAMRALAPRPEDRFPSVDALKRELDAFLEGGGWFATRRFAEGEHLMVAGEAGDAAYRIREGRCRVYREEQGRREVIREVGPGGIVGELALLTEGARTAHVIALEPILAQVITRESLDFELSDGWVRSLVAAVAERYREVDERARSRAGRRLR